MMTLIGAFIPEVSARIIYFLYAISTGLFVYIFLTVSKDIDEITKDFRWDFCRQNYPPVLH
jgi:hypothetical protein